MNPYQFAGGTAVVTGAASGIGEALAVQLAARGSNLVLVDRDKDRLEDVAGRLRAAHPGLALATHVADLSDDAQTDELATTLAAEHPEVEVIHRTTREGLGPAYLSGFARALDEIGHWVKKTRDATFVEKDERGRTVNRCDGIAFTGGCTDTNEFNYLVVKTMRSLGVCYLENQARV